MTENEAIKRIKCKLREFGISAKYGGSVRMNENETNEVIGFLSELEQYRTIGTVGECKKFADVRKQVTEIVNRQLIAGKNNYKEVYSCFYEIADIIQNNY